VNFFPRFSGRPVAAHTTAAPSPCQARESCTNLGAWAFSIAGRGADPTVCCFPCADDLCERARQLDLPVVLERVQPDTCYLCSGRVAGDRQYLRRSPPIPGHPPHAVGVVGPFCGMACAVKWSSAPRDRQGLS
jgi:hypothetical protein